MSNRVNPINLLRDYFIQKKPIKVSGTNLVFDKVKLPLDTPTAYKPKNSNKRYNLGDLWLFLSHQLDENKQKSQYYGQIAAFKKEKKIQIQIVSVPHQTDIVKYFSGQVDFTENIDETLREDVKAKDLRKRCKLLIHYVELFESN